LWTSVAKAIRKVTARFRTRQIEPSNGCDTKVHEAVAFDEGRQGTLVTEELGWNERCSSVGA